jgi:hypothetical protein
MDPLAKKVASRVAGEQDYDGYRTVKKEIQGHAQEIREGLSTVEDLKTGLDEAVETGAAPFDAREVSTVYSELLRGRRQMEKALKTIAGWVKR